MGKKLLTAQNAMGQGKNSTYYKLLRVQDVRGEDISYAQDAMEKATYKPCSRVFKGGLRSNGVFWKG
jgi:hypothetical protein